MTNGKLEHPLALQIGGSNPERIEAAIELVESYGGIFSEYNLNAGCPSPKVANKHRFSTQKMLQEPEVIRVE